MSRGIDKRRPPAATGRSFPPTRGCYPRIGSDRSARKNLFGDLHLGFSALRHLSDARTHFDGRPGIRHGYLCASMPCFVLWWSWVSCTLRVLVYHSRTHPYLEPILNLFSCLVPSVFVPSVFLKYIKHTLLSMPRSVHMYFILAAATEEKRTLAHRKIKQVYEYSMHYE